ncbi:MAG: glycosyltransferase [Bacteroidales bacterium]|nr:glycosyltransferase [Bacteroidales bacterium]
MIAALIATSMKRCELLFTRALRSVLNQTRKADIIIIVDDNEDCSESLKIQNYLEKLNNPSILYLHNSHVSGISGTGAWNTGIEYIIKEFGPDAYVAILDDDDEWKENHLSVCISAIEQHPECIGVFPWIYRTDYNRTLHFNEGDLTIERFLIGDPGIQGSNMVIKTCGFVQAGMFDENMPSCTDRDMMIRLLQRFPQNAFHAIPEHTVNYYISDNSITYNREKKHHGLDVFFKKYLKTFPSLRCLELSLKRAKKLFDYDGDNFIMEYKRLELIAIGVAIHNNENSIARCLKSIVTQKGYKRHLKIVIGDDASEDNWKGKARPYLDILDVDILNLNNKNVSQTRNDINNYIRKYLKHVAIVGRLDADDEYANDNVLKDIEYAFESTKADVVIGANGYRVNGKLIDKKNADNERLIDPEYLKSRIDRMALGITEAELPSCNTFFKPEATIPYPDVTSAEDHFHTTYYLTHPSLFKVIVTNNIMVTNYNLTGTTTQNNLHSGAYIKNRTNLKSKITSFFIENERITSAKKDLAAAGIDANSLSFLGQGQEGVVFHDYKKVYKVFLPLFAGENDGWLKRHIQPFESDKLLKSKHFYRIKFLSENIITYEYQCSEECNTYSIEEVLSFLCESWRYKIIVKDCKPKNFIRVNGTIKLIDMKGYDYDDNLFLNMCARMYLYAKYGGTRNKSEMRKLTRSAINNFELPELSNSFREFVNSVYAAIIWQESITAINSLQRKCSGTVFEEYAFGDLPNLEQLYYKKLRAGLALRDLTVLKTNLSKENYFTPQSIRIGYDKISPIKDSISFLIKCCPQDVNTLEANVKHIVRQLCQPEMPSEIILGIDPYAGAYLREFNNNGDLETLLRIASKLKTDGIIDRYIVYADTEESNRTISKRWFGCESPYSHTEDLKPVLPQLFALEACLGNYILQMDSDVLVGRDDYSHKFLSEMLDQLKTHDNVISVGFNIPNEESKQYYGFENGGFVPEIRLGLFDKRRLLAARPLPNPINNCGHLTTSWFRALETKQRESGLCSIRGGDKRTFYIHPQNYRKKYPSSWMPILDRIEQGFIPKIQIGKFDCDGSLMEWCRPKRNEEVVIVSVFRNVRYDRFLRFWTSVISQTDEEFGILLFDDASDNGLPFFIENIIKGYENRVTYIKSRVKSTRMENVYTCIHKYMSNQQSVILMVDGDDALIGNTVVRQLKDYYRYYDCDVIVGRFHQTYRIQPHYRYPVDFQNPREKGGNVWQHLKTFKKYLFDSIPRDYFVHSSNKLWKWGAALWFENVDDFAMMVPIVEMSEKPMQMDIVNYYYERDYEHRNDKRELKEQIISEILNKPALHSGNYHIGRKKFLPKFDKIELDITHDCNLKCHGCNRSCGLAPTKECVTIEQIKAFISESKDLGIKWTLINVLGGEPTLHPDFLEIIRILKEDYICTFSPNTILQVVSNGFTEISRQLCEEAKRKHDIVIDYASFKTSNKIDYFTQFNNAPIDDPAFKNADYTSGCWVAEYCGINMNHNGFFACSICGANDRVMSANSGVKSLKELTHEKIMDHFKSFCPFCGNFSEYDENYGDNIIRSEKRPYKEFISVSWQTIYNEYAKKT